MNSISKNLVLLIVLGMTAIGASIFAVLNYQGHDLRVEFELSDTQGKTVTQQDLWGKWSIMTLGFTNCPDICPSHAARIASSLQTLSSGRATQKNGGPAAPVQAVFISVDFLRDDAQQLDTYLKYFHPDYRGYLGSQEQLDRAVESFEGFYSLNKTGDKENEKVEVVHSSLIYIVDPYGRVVKRLPFGVTAEKIAEEVQVLL